MRDRLAELKTKVRDVENGQDTTAVTIETSASGSLATFFNEVEVIGRTLTDMEAAIRRLKDVHSRILNTAYPSVSLREEPDDIEGQIRIMAVRSNKQIKGLERCLPKPTSTACARMLAVQQSALSQRLQTVLACLSEEQLKYRKQLQDLLKAQIKVTRSSVLSDGANEEAERLLDLDQRHVSIFTDHHMQSTREAHQQLADAQARHEDLLTLERSIREVHSLFLDISLLIDSQGGMIDNIESHVTKAADQIIAGRKELAEAEIKKKSSRKKKICLIVCGMTTLLILLLVFIYLAFYGS